MPRVQIDRAPRMATAAPMTLSGRDAADRERLLDAVRRAGLEPDDVVRLAEVITGRPWEQVGKAEVGLVARALVAAAGRLRARWAEEGRPCAG
jgi:hypothetical protein